MKCGRQPGGDKADELGGCPAADDRSYDGINCGQNADRFCWAVAGTFCGGKVQGTFADKRESCLSCGFFNKVRAEEGTANLRTKFLRFISEDADGPVFKNMRYEHIPAGKRFIIQGQEGDAAYIIQRGGFSIIYKGMHLGPNMPVAIKMMRHDLAMDPDFLRTFRNEAKTIAGLDHQNIIKVYDIEERFQTVFLIMEYLEGETLNKMLNRLKIIPPGLAVHYLIQIGSGLQYAHSRGIIHRDVNSSNLLIQRDDQLKILDFGLACPIGTHDFNSFGTLAYMAPEQIRGDPMDQRTDIFALGITAYEMLVGRRPFPEEDAQALEEMHLNHDIPDPEASVADLPKGLRRFIIKSCQRDPGLRYDDFNQVQVDLERIAKARQIGVDLTIPDAPEE